VLNDRESVTSSHAPLLTLRQKGAKRDAGEADPKFAEKQPQLLRPQLAQETRQPLLKMTTVIMVRTSDQDAGFESGFTIHLHFPAFSRVAFS
jgi:hypothetical protein